MHENSKRNAMLTKQRKKRGKGNKLQQGGAGSIMGVLNSKQKKRGKSKTGLAGSVCKAWVWVKAGSTQLDTGRFGRGYK